MNKTSLNCTLENLWKQMVAWKPHYHNSPTWISFKVNNNQPVEISQNQIMKCIICQNDIVPLEILAMCTICKKGFIAYHKFNDITTTKKHVNSNHYILLKKLLEDATNITSRSPLNCGPIKKRACVCPIAISSFFLLSISLKEMMQHNSYYWRI